MIQGDMILNIMLLCQSCFFFIIKKKARSNIFKAGEIQYVFVFQIQKREIKMCALVKELTESKKQHSECQNEVETMTKALLFIF